MLLILFILLISLVSIYSDDYVVIPFTCETRQGSSTSNPSLMSSISCDIDETLVSCGIIGLEEI